MTGMDLCDAIAAVVSELWPERIIYRDFCPVDHRRPSSYLYVSESSMEPANLCLVEWTVEARLELFCATDEYDLSSTEALRRDQEQVLLAFAAPSLKVGGRWVTLAAQGDGMDMGSAFVNFSATWFDDRPSYTAPEETAPLMEHAEVSGTIPAGGMPDIKTRGE